MGHTVSPDQLAILRFMALADGEGATLAHDIAGYCGFNPRSMGFRMRGLERRGLIRRVVVRDAPSIRSSSLFGWVFTDAGREAL